MVVRDSKLSLANKQAMVRLAISKAKPGNESKAKPSSGEKQSFWALMKAQAIVKSGQSPATAVVETCFLLRISKSKD